jgi:hypothetical protein
MQSDPVSSAVSEMGRAANSSHLGQNCSVLSNGKRASSLQRPPRIQAFEKRSSHGESASSCLQSQVQRRRDLGLDMPPMLQNRNVRAGRHLARAFAKHTHMRSDRSPRMDVGSRTIWAESTSAASGLPPSVCRFIAARSDIRGGPKKKRIKSLRQLQERRSRAVGKPVP